MGVRGLTTFIANNSKRYLKPTNLQDTYLVVDGNCVASHLYKWCTYRDSAFGGDYDEYYVVVKRFFVLLKKCNITAIVVLDGGYETKKIPTVLHRLKTKLFTLRNSFRAYSRTKFFPLFLKLVFCEAVESCNVTLLQTEFEADREIAFIARQLACPVMSYDSDFYIYDVLYIPFDTVSLEPAGTKESVSLSCSVYNVLDFLDEFPGLKKCHLPFLATVLGNDFVDNYIFNNFFKQIPQSKKSKTSTVTERKIQGLLNWLRHESGESAVSKLLQNVSKKNHGMILKSFAASADNYSANCNLEVTVENGKILVTQLESILKINCDIRKLLRMCRLPSFITDMTTMHTYFIPLQIEDLKEASSHLPALPIIAAIHTLVCLDEEEPVELKAYLRDKAKVKVNAIPATVGDSTLSQLREGPVSVKKQFIFKVLNLSEKDISCVDEFLDECRMFLSCFLTWSFAEKTSSCHMHSLLYTYFGCQAQNKVGEFRTTSMNDDSHTFVSMLSPMRKTTEAARDSYSPSIVHVFSVFQSILYHMSILNVILGYPFTPCKVTDSFSGTLVYNVFSDLISRNDLPQYISVILEPVPAIAHLYSLFYGRLERFFPATPKVEPERKRRKRKKKRNVTETQVIMESSGDSDNSYEDINNKFAALLTA